MPEKDLGIDLGKVTTTQEHELGTEYTYLGRVYVYRKSGGTIALGDVLKFDAAEETYSVIPVAAADEVVEGCWPNENETSFHTARAAIADNSFFWMLKRGDALVKAAATVVAGAPAVTIATAGTVDDTAATAANALAAGAGCAMMFLSTTSGGFARVRFS